MDSFIDREPIEPQTLPKICEKLFFSTPPAFVPRGHRNLAGIAGLVLIVRIASNKGVYNDCCCSPRQVVNLMPVNEMTAAGYVGFSLSGDAVSLSMFTSVADSLAKLLGELETSITGTQLLDWHIEDLRVGSANLAIKPAALEPGNVELGNTVISSTLNGLALVEDSPKRPLHFSDAALRCAKSLVSATKYDAGRLAIFGGNGAAAVQQIAVSMRLAAHVDELIGFSTVAIGSLEGTLETMTIHDSIAFSIYDSITNRRTLCRCSRETLDFAIKHFGERMSVSGEIKFNVRGEPMSMRVAELRPLGDGLLPQPEDIRGLFSDDKVDMDQ